MADDAPQGLSRRFVVYRAYSEAGDLLYIGSSMSVLTRISAHKRASSWFNDVARIDLERFPSREQMIVAEILAIKAENPKHNATYSTGGYLTVQQAANHIGMCRDFVRTRIAQGVGPKHIVKGKKIVLIALADLEEWDSQPVIP